MKKSIAKVYFVVLLITVALAMIAQVAANSELVLSTEKTTWHPINILSERELTEDEREIEVEWEQEEAPNSCMVFFSSHHDVHVYADGILVYANERADSIFGHTTGARWNFVEIPQETKRILVDLDAIYPQVRGQKMDFFQGNARQIYIQMLREAIFEMIVCSINIMIGVAMMCYWLLARKRIELKRDILFVGVLAFIVGIWSINETDAAILLFSNRVAATFLSYILLMLMSTPYILFENSFMDVKNKAITNILCYSNILNIIVCLTLHFTGVKDLREILISTHILMFLAVLYTVWLLYTRVRDYGWDKKVKINIAGEIALVLSFTVDIIGYYLGVRQTDIFGKFGLLLFIFFIGAQAVSELFDKIDEGRKAEIYHELAVKDMLTGLYNRNAYDSWQAQSKHWNDAVLAIFDLNNLKECNDTLGHADGDIYIKTVAAMILEVFGNVGRCYRIGGDEFCVVLKDGRHVNMEKKIEQLRQLEQEHNKKNTKLSIQIACGYATFDDKIDKNMEDTRNRADMLMYENKKKIKEKVV